MANYYFLATLLPGLKVGSPPQLGSKELNFLLEQNLTKKDAYKIVVMRRLQDVENIKNMLLSQPFQSGGNFKTAGELTEALNSENGLPDYLLHYWHDNKDKDSRQEMFPKLLRDYFDIESKSKDEFLSTYLIFEWHWRLIFVALRAKELDRDIKYEMRFENPNDPFINQILIQNESATFDPPYPFTSLKALFETRKHAPLDLYQALCEWRFEQIKEMIHWQSFSTARILSYVAQLEICEKWLELNKRKGLQLLEEIIEP